MLINAVGVGLDLVVIVILRNQHVPSAQIGLVLAAAAVGSLAGAPLVRPLHRIRPGILLLGVCAIEVPLLAGMALPYGAWWVAGLLFVPSLGVLALRVLVDVLIFRRTPDQLRGRAVAAVMTMLAIGMPAGHGADRRAAAVAARQGRPADARGPAGGRRGVLRLQARAVAGDVAELGRGTAPVSRAGNGASSRR